MLPLPRSYPPMEARLTDKLPRDASWQYEPKWDGFRCIAFIDDGNIDLRSKKGLPLGRYFPELESALREIPVVECVLDGEIVVVTDSEVQFDALLQRIHPSESRILKLSRETPATYIVFDLLVAPGGVSLVDRSLKERRALLEVFAREHLHGQNRLAVSPITLNPEAASRWLDNGSLGIDGVVAKRLDAPYLSGERTGMLKVKRIRTVDCVVGGFRYASAGKVVGSLLLGLYDSEGLLHHVGFCSAFTSAQRIELTGMVEKFAGGQGFTGRAPGAPSRWSTERSTQWVPLKPVLVVEVEYDHYSGDRIRHGTRFVRFRPDKKPKDCTIDQVARASAKIAPRSISTDEKSLNAPLAA